MPKFSVDFTTTIKGSLTIEADTQAAAEHEARNLAQGTLNYDELTDGGRKAPDVETKFDDITEVNE